MDTFELSGPGPVTVHIRRSKRARRLSLRVSGIDGRVVLSLPMRTPLREARTFAEEQAGWIRKHMATRPDVVRPEIGGTVLFGGQDTAIVAGRGRTARMENGEIIVPAAADMVAARVGALFKLKAREQLEGASQRYAAVLGVTFGRITLRDTRSRWGSCTSQGNLMYSWRLVMAPPQVLQYVAAHEVSHLVEMNHSPAYWQVVAGIFPGYAAPRQWLRDHGNRLHNVRFKD
jgi:predicted metal-dependent hydrolase